MYQIVWILTTFSWLANEILPFQFTEISILVANDNAIELDRHVVILTMHHLKEIFEELRCIKV